MNIQKYFFASLIYSSSILAAPLQYTNDIGQTIRVGGAEFLQNEDLSETEKCLIDMEVHRLSDLTFMSCSLPLGSAEECCGVPEDEEILSKDEDHSCTVESCMTKDVTRSLISAINDQDIESLKRILSPGIRFQESYLSAIAAEKANVEIFDLVLNHGPIHRNALKVILSSDDINLEMAKLAILHGGLDRYSGRALELFIRNNDFEMVDFLLNRGSKDLLGYALAAAIEKEERNVFKKMAYTFLGAFWKDNDTVVERLLSHGSKDLLGFGLAAAVRIGDITLLKRLLNHGSKDPGTYAIRTAKALNRVEMVEILESHKNK